jgi:hypothetical protein
MRTWSLVGTVLHTLAIGRDGKKYVPVVVDMGGGDQVVYGGGGDDDDDNVMRATFC